MALQPVSPRWILLLGLLLTKMVKDAAEVVGAVHVLSSDLYSNGLSSQRAALTQIL